MRKPAVCSLSEVFVHGIPFCSSLVVTGRDPPCLCFYASFFVLPCLPLLQEVVCAVCWQGQGQREGQGWWWWWWVCGRGRGGVVVMAWRYSLRLRRVCFDVSLLVMASIIDCILAYSWVTLLSAAPRFDIRMASGFAWFASCRVPGAIITWVGVVQQWLYEC